MPSSTTLTAGTSGSLTSSRSAQMSSSVSRSGRAFAGTRSLAIRMSTADRLSVSPCCGIGIGPLQELHFCQNETEVFGVLAVLATHVHPGVFRAGSQGRLGEHLVDPAAPVFGQLVRVRANACLGHHTIGIVRSDQFTGKAPEDIDSILHPAVAFLGAIAQTLHPL